MCLILLLSVIFYTCELSQLYPFSLFLCLLVQSVTERGILKFPITVVNLFPFSSVNFMYLEGFIECIQINTRRLIIFLMNLLCYCCERSLSSLRQLSSWSLLCLVSIYWHECFMLSNCIDYLFHLVLSIFCVFMFQASFFKIFASFKILFIFKWNKDEYF